MRRIDDKFRERPAETIMDTLRELHAMRRAEKVEVSLFVPVAHNGEPIEQRNVMLLRHHTHII